MITVNGLTSVWREGLTVTELLVEKNFVYTKIIVKINGKVIEKQDYPVAVIHDGDDVGVIHLLAGG